MNLTNGSIDLRVITNMKLLLERRGYTHIAIDDSQTFMTAFSFQGNKPPEMQQHANSENKQPISNPIPVVEKAAIFQYFDKLNSDAMKDFIRLVNKQNLILRNWMQSRGITCDSDWEYRGMLGCGSVTSGPLANKNDFEIFKLDDILFDKTSHALVPPHIRATEEEKAKLEECGIKKHQLPILLVTDPISCYYGFKEGEIIKILRKGGSIFWRCVASSPDGDIDDNKNENEDDA